MRRFLVGDEIMPPITRSQSVKAAAKANVGRQPVVDKESESELALSPQKKRRRLDKPVKDEVSNKKSKVNKKAKKKALTGKSNKRKRNILRTIHKRIDRDRAKIGNISQQPSPQSSILMDQAGDFQQGSEEEMLVATGNHSGSEVSSEMSSDYSSKTSMLSDSVQSTIKQIFCSTSESSFKGFSEEETLDTSESYDISTPSKNSSNLDNVRSRSLFPVGTKEPMKFGSSLGNDLNNETSSEENSDNKYDIDWEKEYYERSDHDVDIDSPSGTELKDDTEQSKAFLKEYKKVIYGKKHTKRERSDEDDINYDNPKSHDMQQDSTASLQRELKANAKHFRTKSDGNCFFHAVFGDVNSSGIYETDKAQAMRQEWCKFLGEFKSLEDKSMPKELKRSLLLIFTEVFSEEKPEEFNSDHIYIKYLAKIAEQSYYIYVNEIPILASLANIEIKLRIEGQRPHDIKPDKELLSKDYKRDDELWGKRKQVEIYHNGRDHFSHLISHVEQSSSPLKDVVNSPTRRRNPIIPKSPGKENSPKKRKYSAISKSRSFNDSEIGFLSKHNSRQTSTPLKKYGSFEDTKVNITPIKPDELSKKGRKLNHFKRKKSAKGQACFVDEDDSGLGSSLLSSSKILKTDKELETFLKECKEVGKIAIHCDYEDKGLSKVSLFCNKGRIYYIDEKFEQNALEEINELLSSGKVEKVIVYDIKEVKKTLSGIEKILDSVDDLKVMSYSLDTKKHDNSISSIVEHNFGRIEETFSAETLIKIHNKLESRLSEQKELRKIYDNYDKPLTKVILNMEKKGIRVDVKRLEELDKTLDNKIKTLEKEIHKLAGIKFEIRSSKKLESILFNKMKLQDKTGLNNLSGTDSKTLGALESRGVEIAGKVLRWRSLDKLKSNVKGYIDKVDKNGIVHTDFLTTKTKTGRIVSKEPNLQNIPFGVEEASLIRQAFVAEEGQKLISVDYLQMELRILAEIANVKKFKEAFSKGEDIHAITAKQIFGRDDGKFRQKAKAINFGIIYGMSEYQLAKELEVSTQKAKTYIEKYYKEYPEIEEYKRKTVAYGRVNHYVETFSGRRINTEYISSRIIPVKEHYRRAAVNARIQGTGADMIRLAMIKLSKELKEKNLGEIINTIHDELIVEAEDGKAEEVQKLMKEMMEKTAKEIIGVDIPVKINVGDDLNFRKELNEDQQETRDHLQENDDFTMSYDDSGYNSLLQEDEEETDDFINNYDLEGEEYRNSCFDILGIEYQVLVSMLCFHRAFNVHGEEYKNLSLATEEDQKKVGKFDDIVIRYTDKEDKKKAINVQVKRIDEEEGYNEINCTTLFPEGEGKNKDMFAINKYFISFLNQDKERRDETKHNVIFTNSDLATKDGKKVKYKLLKHSGIEVDEVGDEVLEDLLCTNKEQPGFYNFSKGEVREKILKVIDPLQNESRKKIKRILEKSTFSKVRIEKIEELLNSPPEKKKKLKS